MSTVRVPGPVPLALLVAVGLVVVVQLLNLDELMDPVQPLSAGEAKGPVVAYALAVLIVVGAAAALPSRLLWLPVAATGAGAASILLLTCLLSGELDSLAWAALTLAACWRAGSWGLAAARLEHLAGLVPVAWLVGVGLLGLFLLILGHAGALHWWTAAAPVLAVGLAGMVAGARLAWPGATGTAWRAVTSTRLAAACGSLCLMAAGLAAIWAAPPELMFDSLSYKAWLPSEWARTGEIAPLITHPIFNVWGYSQLLAVPGHLSGADGVGRYLQWIAQGGLVVTVWWAVRGSAWAPLAGAAVALTPLFFWEETTAYEDTLLSLAAVAMGLAVWRVLERPEGSALVQGLVIGALAGICIDLKLHLFALVGGLALGWLVLRGRGGWASAVAGVLVGAVLAIGPSMLIRWIDLENPVLPFLNGIFDSPYWPQEEDPGFRRLWRYAPPALAVLALAALGLLLLRRRGRPAPDGRRMGLIAIALVALVAAAAWAVTGEPPRPVEAIGELVTDPGLHVVWAPVGTLGVIALATPVALLIGIGTRGRPEITMLCIGIAVAAATWSVSFRDPRYLMPASCLAVIVIGIWAGGARSSRRLELGALALLAVTTILLWPSTIAQYWNVPGRGVPWKAAFGQLGDREYEVGSSRAREVASAFNRLAPPGALVMTALHQRLWLDDGRDFTGFFEVNDRLRARGSVPDRPAETLAAVESVGVRWVFTNPSDELSGFPYLMRMLEAYGTEVWSSDEGTLYRLDGA